MPWSSAIEQGASAARVSGVGLRQDPFATSLHARFDRAQGAELEAIVREVEGLRSDELMRFEEVVRSLPRVVVSGGKR